MERGMEGGDGGREGVREGMEGGKGGMRPQCSWLIAYNGYTVSWLRQVRRGLDGGREGGRGRKDGGGREREQCYSNWCHYYCQDQNLMVNNKFVEICGVY